MGLIAIVSIVTMHDVTTVVGRRDPSVRQRSISETYCLYSGPVIDVLEYGKVCLILPLSVDVEVSSTPAVVRTPFIILPFKFNVIGAVIRRRVEDTRVSYCIIAGTVPVRRTSIIAACVAPVDVCVQFACDGTLL